MDLINAKKLIEKAFLAIGNKNDEISPVDLIAQLQSEMKEFAIFTNDYEDLEEINSSSSFDFLK